MVKHVDVDQLSGAERERARNYAMVIEWSDEDQLFLVSIPDFPGAHTHGETRAEAVAMGEEILALLLDGRPNPPPAHFTAMPYAVRVEAEVHTLAAAAHER